MEANPVHEEYLVEEVYVLLDLEGLSGQLDIPPNAPYVLSGLVTLNLLLTIGNNLKLVGEYEETIGTCIVFKEEVIPTVHEETGPSEENLFSGKCTIDPNKLQKCRNRENSKIRQLSDPQREYSVNPRIKSFATCPLTHL